MTSSLVVTGKPRLFYGVNSEGMGHAMRCLPIIERLQQKYEVSIFCGGRVKALMSSRFERVYDLFYIPLVYRENRMLVGESFARAFLRAPHCFRDAGWLMVKMLRERPVAVITDYEFLTCWCGFLTGQKVVCVDNNHMTKYAQLPAPRTKEEEQEKQTVLTASSWNVPFAKKTLLTSFWQPGLLPGVDASKVRFAPCSVRDEVLARKSRVREDGPVLVYQTSSTNRRLPAVLKEAVATSSSERALSFKVYGAGQPPHKEPGIEWCAFDGDAFLDDLAACPFVIINGGHSTVVEALALGKAVLAEPIQNQYEQTVNALGIEALGIGRAVDVLHAKDIVDFAARASEHRARAAAAAAVVDNDGLVAAVEEAIADVLATR